MPLAGVRLTMQEALALCYVRGWRRSKLTQAVALMCAESGRYTEAWHENLADDGVTVKSTDRGLYQVNDVSHPTLDDTHAYDGVYNSMYAFKLWKAAGFTPWAAYNSGAYLKFVRDVRLARLRFYSWRRLRSSIDETVHFYASEEFKNGGR